VDAIFIVEVLLPVALNISVWWLLRHPAIPGTTEPWRKRSAYFGLGFSSLAYVLPWLLILYTYVVFHRNRAVDASQLISGVLVLQISLVLAAISFVLGAIGPKSVRIQLMLSAAAIALLWMSIPIGV
jgi:hypothetical protein